MKTNQSNLRRQIMRRVWYSYFISILFSFTAFSGFVFGSSAMLFVNLVSVPDIFKNLLQVQLGTVPEYVWQVLVQTVYNGEFMTLLTLGLIIFSLLSFRFQFNKGYGNATQASYV